MHFDYALPDPYGSSIILIDMDCFQVRLWQMVRSDLRGKPCAIVTDHGKVTTVNYEAKRIGVSRNAYKSAKVAKQECPALNQIIIPNRYGKPDIKQARLASYKIYEIIKDYCQTLTKKPILEFSSKDEFYLDVTDEVNYRVSTVGFSPPVKTQEQMELMSQRIHFIGRHRTLYGVNVATRVRDVLGNPANIRVPRYQEQNRLMYAAVIAQQIIHQIKINTTSISHNGVQCAAGISYNKLLAKLICRLKKPGGISVLPQSGVARISKCIGISSLPGLYGSRAIILYEKYDTKVMFDLSHIPIRCLTEEFGQEVGMRIHNMCWGIDPNPVIERDMSKDVSSTYYFKGVHLISSVSDLYPLIFVRCDEVVDRCYEELVRLKKYPKSFTLVIYKLGQRSTMFSAKVQAPESSKLNAMDLFLQFKQILQREKFTENDLILVDEIRLLASFPSPSLPVAD